MINAPYLTDKEFLKKFDLETHKTQFIRIYVLDFNTEQIIGSLEGKSTGGSCNLSGTSNMRRTANLTLLVDPYNTSPIYHNITEIQNLISMNKKVKIETGYINTLGSLNYYPDYDIIWFPLGTYVIKAGNISKNNSGINISLTLNDKCALLNGDMGGVIPAATVFSETELFNSTGDKRSVEKILLKDIIKNIVVEYGGEDPNNVIITDIDDYIVKVMKWSGKTDLYLITDKNYFTTNKPEDGVEYLVFKYGDDIGYINEPFVYPGTLECKAGETVAIVLDKIKNTLGNFEWFYDVDGRFIFREIRNYLNKSNVEDILTLQLKDYTSYTDAFSKSNYVFDETNKSLILSISNSPQFPNIKNDFVVWGAMKTASGATKPLRYHLSLRSKPMISTIPRLAIVYKDERQLYEPIFLNSDNYEVISDLNNLKDPNKNKYYINKNSNNIINIYAWDEYEKVFRTHSDWILCYLLPSKDDWRTELYYQGLEADNKTFSQNYYSAELNFEWPKICNILGTKLQDKTQSLTEEINLPIYKSEMYSDIKTSNYEFWLDFLDGDGDNNQSIAPFTIDNIGRRSKIITDNNSNCVFPVEIPNYVLVEADGDNLEEIKIAENKGQTVIQVSSDIYKNLSLGGNHNSAFDKIKELLYLHTNYNESISLSIIPIYHLEPNMRITIFDNDVSINGDYMIKTISIPLVPSGSSNVSATKIIDKTF